MCQSLIFLNQSFRLQCETFLLNQGVQTRTKCRAGPIFLMFTLLHLNIYHIICDIYSNAVSRSQELEDWLKVDHLISRLVRCQIWIQMQAGKK